eukprot:403339851
MFRVKNQLESKLDLLFEIYGFLQISPQTSFKDNQMFDIKNMLSQGVNESLNIHMTQIGQKLNERMTQIQKDTEDNLKNIELFKHQFLINFNQNPGMLSADKFIQGFEENIAACQKVISPQFMEYFTKLNQILRQPQEKIDQ